MTERRPVVPLFRPVPAVEAESAMERIVECCTWLVGQPTVPPTVPLRSRMRRPLPLGLTRVLGIKRVALGPVPDVRGWVVRWQEADPAGEAYDVGYLVTRSGRTFRLGRANIAMFSDRHGFPPQPNPVSAAHAARIVAGLRALVAGPVPPA